MKRYPSLRVNQIASRGLYCEYDILWDFKFPVVQNRHIRIRQPIRFKWKSSRERMALLHTNSLTNTQTAYSSSARFRPKSDVYMNLDKFKAQLIYDFLVLQEITSGLPETACRVGRNI